MMKLLKRSAMIVLSSVMGALASSPLLLRVGPEELLGTGRLPAIAVDALAQPHVVSDGGSMIYLYDRVGGIWRSLVKDAKIIVNAPQYYNPHIEIDRLDRAWISGTTWSPAGGVGVFVRSNVSSNPSDFNSIALSRAGAKLPVGLLSTDPAFPDECVVMGTAGGWQRGIFDPTQAGSVRLADEGRLPVGAGGEKTAFWISKAGSVRHPGGRNQAVWHTAMGGYYGDYSAYINSLMQARGQGRVIWANYPSYPSMKDDGAYVRVVSDNEAQEVAYITCDFSVNGKFSGTVGVAMNIFDGQGMVFSPNNILVLDRSGRSGLRRFAPQSAPAKDGGVFVSWTRGGQVIMRHVPATTKSVADVGSEIVIGAGGPAAIAVDQNGNVHAAYNRGGQIFYRFLEFNVVTSYITVGQNFDGEGGDDLAIYDPEDYKWHIRTKTGESILNGAPWGFPGVVPAPGRYFGNDRAQLGVYHPSSGRWFLRDIYSGVVRNGIQWGYTGTLAVPGDYNGDGVDDLAVYAPSTGQWNVLCARTGRRILQQHFGFLRGLPVPGDYNGDGSHDLAVFDTQAARWYIASPNRFVMDRLNWGWPGAQVVAADYAKKGVTDLGVYDPNSGNWYIADANGSIIAWKVGWGFPGTVAVTGDYDGDGIADLAVYSPAQGKWWIKKLNGTVLADGVDWGFPGTIAVTGDYDGDGIADLALYDPDSQRWFVLALKGGVLVNGLRFGAPGAIPIAADFNKNGRYDLGYYMPVTGRWFASTIEGQILMNGLVAGDVNAIPVVGNFDGKGGTQLATYQGGLWTALRLGKTLAWNLQWGWTGVRPVAGDFSGNGRSDLVVAAEDGQWWRLELQSGSAVRMPDWGFPGTIPLAKDTNGDGLREQVVYDCELHQWWLAPQLAPIEFGSEKSMPIGATRFYGLEE